MRAMTTAALVLCPELPPSGLRQSMHNPTIPLKLDNIFNSPAISGMDGGIGLEITRSLISDAIKRIHADGVNRVFTPGSYPQMPNIDCLKANKTQFWQFGAIFEDEGTIKGTYGVHTSIFIDQLGLRAPEDPNESESRAGDKQRITFTKNETSQGTDLLWMRLAEAPWGRMTEYSLQACLRDSRLRRHVFHESGFINN